MNKIDLMVERWRKAGIKEDSIQMALDTIKKAEEYRKLRTERLDSIANELVR